MARIRLDNITKRFGAVLANDCVSFKVAPGTIHAIVGENGAGKSTAMRIAYGFYTADGGEILINGQVREIIPFRGLGREAHRAGGRVLRAR